LPLEYVASTYCTVTESPFAAAGPVPVIKSAHWSSVGGVPEGTVTVGWVPVVPAGERSSAGMGAMEPQPPDVDEDAEAFVLDVDDALDGFDGEELQAARPNAPATPMRAARDQGRRVRDMARDGSRSTLSFRGTLARTKRDGAQFSETPQRQHRDLRRQHRGPSTNPSQ
jgi:hypothetical protein